MSLQRKIVLENQELRNKVQDLEHRLLQFQALYRAVVQSDRTGVLGP